MLPEDEEILEVFQRAKETDEKFAEKMHVWRRLYYHLRKVFLRCNLLPFGSTMTGFALQGSDLDIVILLPRNEFSSRVQVLEACERALVDSKDRHLSQFELIDCRTPILVLQDTSGQSPLKIELSCGSPNLWDGTRNTHLLLSYSDLDPRVRRLVIVLKTWADFHVLLGTRHKRLSGYSLALMLLFYLQRTPIPVVPVLQRHYPNAFGHQVPVIEHLNYTFKVRMVDVLHFLLTVIFFCFCFSC